jgi:hypothetical protein
MTLSGTGGIMETVGKSNIWAYFDRSSSAKRVTNSIVRKGPGHRVRSFLDLATKVADLQFRNRDYVLLFRGQGADHRNKANNTSLKASLFRPVQFANPSQQILETRYEALMRAERALVSCYAKERYLGVERLMRHRILRWSILQHYEVCPTPLLDVTHSLRIAASFASLSAKDDAFLFVLAVPNLSGAITASAEAGLQIVRLSSVCPPTAVRPHIQEGYLLGEYPDIESHQQKQHYFHYEMDFGLRLVSKFRFRPTDFWKRNDGLFPMVLKRALYPSKSNDPLYELSLSVKKMAGLA